MIAASEPREGVTRDGKEDRKEKLGIEGRLYTKGKLTDKIGSYFIAMYISKTCFLILGVSVISLGIILGTFLWLKLAPKPERGEWDAKPLEDLSRHGAVPEFSLTERSGKSTGLAALRGKVWIADFIYTNCTDTCPLQTAEMAKLQEQWHDQPELKLVSFSVDPARDTPKVLSRYADKFKADGDRWLFLTGEKERITRLVQEGFHLSAAPAPDGAKESGVVLHSPRFVLVDKEAQIRGYYDSRDGEALRRLRDDVAILLKG